MIELILLLCIYTIYEYYTGRLTIDNILSLLTICILKLYGKELYWFIDAFIKNNIWIFLLLVCVISICAIRK